jgi:hypothetical protein
MSSLSSGYIAFDKSASQIVYSPIMRVSSIDPASILDVVSQIKSHGTSSPCWTNYMFVDLPSSTLSLLFKLFGDVPVNEHDELEVSFLHFDAGTDKEDIWHWFESMNAEFSIYKHLFSIN